MKRIRCFFIWQDDKEEAWLKELSLEDLRLDSVNFPFTYNFNEEPSKKYAYHLNAPKDPGMNLETFKKPFQESGWEHIGRMNGWHYFRKEVSGETELVLDWGNKTKADKYQKSMMFLVGLLPFFLIIFPAIGKRFAPPLFDILKIAYFIFLALYTLTTFKVYRRVNQLRDL
ncbi:MAG: DUF2812 domain-containing protein [Pelolinea sp.]|nr:DUF2812 domain-containing protein [Pelolinea sp.]